MAWKDAAISALSIVFLIFHAIYSALVASLSAAARLGLYLLRLASWPISAFYNTLLFVFAPVIYTTRWVDNQNPLNRHPTEYHNIFITDMCCEHSPE